MELTCKFFEPSTELISFPPEVLSFFQRCNTKLCCHPAWLSNWLTQYLSKNDRLFFQLHYCNGQVVAVYPMYLKKIWLGFELRFIGTGELEIEEVGSEFQDFLILPEYQQQSLALFSQTIRENSAITRIELNNILEHSVCYLWITQHHNAFRCKLSKIVGRRYALPITASMATQIKQLRQNTLRRQARRFLQQAYTIELCTHPAQVPEFLAELKRLHQKLWETRNKSGAFSTERFNRFHHDFASFMLASDQLLLFKIKSHDKCIAVFYGFFYHDTLYYYQSGICLDADVKHLGVGMHLIAMDFARQKKARCYDMMRGSDASYKSAYLDAQEDVYQIEHQTYLQYLLTRLERYFAW